MKLINLLWVALGLGVINVIAGFVFLVNENLDPNIGGMLLLIGVFIWMLGRIVIAILKNGESDGV